MTQISLQEAYSTACRLLGEAQVQLALLDERVTELEAAAGHIHPPEPSGS